MIKSSPENTKRFLEARIAYIAEFVPEDKMYPVLLDTESVKSYMKNYLKTKVLDTYLEEILNEQAVVTTNDFTLHYIPDIHSSLEGQISESVARQKVIVEALKDKTNKLLFVEGENGELTWSSLFENVKESSKEMNVPGPEKLDDEFKSEMRRVDTKWWHDFLDGPYQLFGYDDKRFHIIIVLYDLRVPDLPQEAGPNTAEWFNNFREQIILARCRREMRKRDQKEAFIVLGQLHTDAFPEVAKKWGINVVVKDF